MKRIVQTAVIALVAALVLGGCEQLLGMLNDAAELSATQRAAAFVQDVEASPQDVAEIKEHFHPDSETYAVINATWWSLTPFDEELGPFTFTTLSEGAADPDYAGSKTVTTSYTSANFAGDRDVTFILLPEGAASDNWLIREITIESSDGYKSIR